MANAYIMRTNMSVAIVAMVNHTAITEKDVPFDEECGTEMDVSVYYGLPAREIKLYIFQIGVIPLVQSLRCARRKSVALFCS